MVFFQPSYISATTIFAGYEYGISVYTPYETGSHSPHRAIQCDITRSRKNTYTNTCISKPNS